MSSSFIVLKDLIQENGITSGYSFRGRIKDESNGSIRVIQMKDLNNDYTGLLDTCFKISSDKIKSKYYLTTGDILFSSKGANNYAFVYEASESSISIASSAFFVIKLNQDIADPYFVAWYINQTDAQSHFKANEAGTYVTSIRKKTLEETPIKLPKLSIQKKISAVANLFIKEKQLVEQLSKQRDQLISRQLLKCITPRQ